MKIKGSCNHRKDKTSFTYYTNDKMLAAKLILLFHSTFITINDNTAYYTTDYKLEISEDISNEICYLADLKSNEYGEDVINKVIITNCFGADDIVITKELDYYLSTTNKNR